MGKVLIIDNYDSFTYNLVHAVTQLTHESPSVRRNDKISMDEIESFSHLILSPGPGLPKEAGSLLQIISTFAERKPILGVCLGHQAIVEAFGGSLINLDHVFHGVSAQLQITKLDEQIYSGMTDLFTAARYHSWVANSDDLPDDLEVNCIDSEQRIMGVTHKKYPVKGVQFHPESFLTNQGYKIFRNFLKIS